MEEAKGLLETDLSVGSVAMEVGYATPRGFGKAFLRHVGCTPSEWIERHSTRPSRSDRVSQAESLLLSGEHSVREVGKLVGFKSYQGLNNAFRSIHGLSPFQWVKRHREQVPIEVMAIPRPHLVKPK
jgi:AraC-like DNA-binding protein